MKLDIRNPLLKKIKEEYKDVFEISQACCEVINNRLGFTLPESEVGYIAMHIGSAIEQIKNTEEKVNHTFNIVVTCISGIGTSKMLAERIKNEFKNLNIIEVFATTNTNDKWLIKNDIDLIVSTVHFENNVVPVISVNPLLLKKDIDKINQKLFSLNVIAKEKNTKEQISSGDRIKSINEFSGAIVELTKNFFFFQDLELNDYKNFVSFISERMSKQSEILNTEILKREKIGSIIFEKEKIIFLHTRSIVADEIMIGVYRNKFDIKHKDGIFNTALVLIAPKEVSKEKLEVISEISSRVVSEENFLSDLKYNDFDDLYIKIEGFLAQLFEKKIK
jgi:mannitol operon transcriptional antiterminator